MNAIVLGRRIILHSIAVPWKTVLWNLGLITLGSILFAIGMNSILIPKGFLSGGLVGMAMIVHYLLQNWDIGFIYFLLNIPLVVLCWFSISHRFMYYSFLGMIIFSVAAGLIKPGVVEIKDPILAALLAGMICGTGGGIILRSLGSAGGLDILTVYLNKKFGFRMGTVIFFSNALVLMAGALLFDLERALYSMIYYYASTRVIEAILAGFNKRKSLLIVSDQAQGIAEKIIHEVKRGITFLHGEGAYTGEEKKVIFTVTSLTELPKIKDLVHQIDPDAFVVVNETLEVLGKRHGKLKVY